MDAVQVAGSLSEEPAQVHVFEHPPGVPPPSAGVVHVDPIAAAKELRKLIRNVREKMGAGEGSLTSAANLTHVKTYLGRASTNTASARQQLGFIETDVLSRLTQAVEERKLIAGREALDSLRQALAMAQAYSRHTAQAENRAIEYAAYVNASGGASTEMNEWLSRMHILIQSLPTVSGAPTNMAENLLLAITTILKNNNYFNKEVTHAASPDTAAVAGQTEPSDEWVGESADDDDEEGDE